MKSKTMQVGTRVCFLADGEFCGGAWTGFYGTCGEFEIRCDHCSRVHWINPEDFLPIPELEPEDFASPKLTYREQLQIENDKVQVEYLTRYAARPRSRYAALAFPLVIAGVCSCIVGAANIGYGNYGYAGLGFLVFLGTLWFADRLERGA